jgi:Ser/Thr protein kinase RdoA (MazF antagonist)
MAEVEDLKIDKQWQLWLKIADLVLRRWNLPPGEMSWLGSNGKVVIKAKTTAGDYVLRLYSAGTVKAAQLQSELHWLSFIHRLTDLLAPFPVGALVDRRKQCFVELHHNLLPHPHKAYAAVFQFLEGEIKSARDLGREDVYHIGEYLGRLHTDAQFDTPEDFDRPRLDWEGLFGDDSPYASPTDNEMLGAEQRGILDDVARQLRAPLAKLAAKPDAMGLIHADLLAKNVIFHGDTLAALDFEFCGWGFYLYDLAPLLWQLKGERASDYPALEDAMWRGYTSIRAAPESDCALLEPFIAARQFTSIRWLLANRQNPAVRELAPSLIAERCEELKIFLETGILRRSTPTL